MPTKTYFYEGLPYQEKDVKDNMVVGINYWTGEIKECEKDRVEYLKDEESIDIKFVEKCKEAFELSLVGWTAKAAKEFEEKGFQCLKKQINNYVKECPEKLYQACKGGRKGYIIYLSDIKLPSELYIGGKPCSDGEVRNPEEYKKYLLNNVNMLTYFKHTYPELHFIYKTHNKDPFKDMYCLAPFYNKIILPEDFGYEYKADSDSTT